MTVRSCSISVRPCNTHAPSASSTPLIFELAPASKGFLLNSVLRNGTKSAYENAFSAFAVALSSAVPTTRP